MPVKSSPTGSPFSSTIAGISDAGTSVGVGGSYISIRSTMIRTVSLLPMLSCGLPASPNASSAVAVTATREPIFWPSTASLKTGLRSSLAVTVSGWPPSS